MTSGKPSIKRKENDLWVITVNWNQPELTKSCVESLLNNEVVTTNLVIVDNGSSDGSYETFLGIFPDLHIIQSSKNIGFAGGFNLGIKYALHNGAEYIYMLNNDTETPAGMLDTLMAQTHKVNADICSPAIYFADSPHKIWSVGGYFNSLLSAPFDAHRRNKPIPYKPTRREFLSGCALVIHKDVFKKIGFFDEAFFLYYEDMDFIKRAHDADLDLWLIPQSKLLHKVSGSSESATSKKVVFLMEQSSWRYFRKHAKSWQWFFIFPWRFLHAIKRICTYIIRNQFELIMPFLSGFFYSKTHLKGSHLNMLLD